MPSITDALRARGIGSGGAGIKQEDLMALIDITNTAEANNDAIKLDVVNKLNALNPALNLTTAASWSTIRAAIASMQNRGAQTITPGPNDITIPAGYHNGAGKVSAVTVPVASVLAGTTIAGQTGTMPNRGAVTITPTAADQTIAAGYHNGAGVVKGVVVPTAKVLNDTTIAQQKGTMPYLTGVRSPAAITIWPDNRDLAVYPEKGYQDGGPGGGEIRITKAHLAQADPNFIAANIVSGKNIFGLVGTAATSGAYRVVDVYENYKTTGTTFTTILSGIKKGGYAVVTCNETEYFNLNTWAESGYGMTPGDYATTSLQLIDDVTGLTIRELNTQSWSYYSPGHTSYRLDSVQIDRVNERVRVRINGGVQYGQWLTFTTATNNPITLTVKHIIANGGNAGVNGGLYSSVYLRVTAVRT